MSEQRFCGLRGLMVRDSECVSSCPAPEARTVCAMESDRCPRCRHPLFGHQPVAVRPPQPNNEATPPKDTGYKCVYCACRKAPFVRVAV